MGIGNHELIQFEEEFGEELFEEFVQKYCDRYDEWVADKPGMTVEDYREQFVIHLSIEWYAFLEDAYTNYVCQNY